MVASCKVLYGILPLFPKRSVIVSTEKAWDESRHVERDLAYTLERTLIAVGIKKLFNRPSEFAKRTMNVEPFRGYDTLNT